VPPGSINSRADHGQCIALKDPIMAVGSCTQTSEWRIALHTYRPTVRLPIRSPYPPVRLRSELRRDRVDLLAACAPTRVSLQSTVHFSTQYTVHLATSTRHDQQSRACSARWVLTAPCELCCALSLPRGSSMSAHAHKTRTFVHRPTSALPNQSTTAEAKHRTSQCELRYCHGPNYTGGRAGPSMSRSDS